MARSLDVYLMHCPPSAITKACSLLLPEVQGERSWPMPPDRMHMTLQTLGRYSPDEGVPAWLLALTARLEVRSFGPPFDVSLDVLQSRDANTLLTTVELTGGGAGVSGVRRLCRQLADEMERVGFPADLIRREMLPHITLDYRHAPVPKRHITPLTWRIEEVCLVVSRNGEGVHEVLARWPLIETQRTLFD